MANTVCHFEIPADDVEALAKFYTELFGWKIEKMGEEMGEGMEYWNIATAPEEEGAVCGGMMKRVHPQQGPTNYVLVEDVAAHTAKAKELGATVVMDKTEIRGVGWISVVIDPQNNCIGMFEEK